MRICFRATMSSQLLNKGGRENDLSNCKLSYLPKPFLKTNVKFPSLTPLETWGGEEDREGGGVNKGTLQLFFTTTFVDPFRVSKVYSVHKCWYRMLQGPRTPYDNVGSAMLDD